MNEYTNVGMDVHARSVACKALRPDTGECWSKTFSGEGFEHELLDWLKKLPAPVRCAYESGCTGFWMSRFLQREGVECEVMAVPALPRSPKNRRHKDDKHDAGVVLREMCNPASDVSYVWVPDTEVEGARDLARAADAASRTVRSAKQRGCMLLVKHGFVWNERTASGNLKKTWTPSWKKWARSCDLGDPLSNVALGQEIQLVERMERSAKELARAVAAEAEKPRWKPYVDALIRLKGVDVQTAFLACAEFGDFSRFRSGRRVSRWIGCTASEDSSGETRRQGKITKEGSSHLRRALVEGISSISRQTAHKKYLRPGHAVSPEVEDIALEANTRLKRRYDAMKGAGKHTNVAKVAVVSELARWMWVLGLQVQRELAAA
ncbi:IS110 family transposase [Curtanaerobium respiraculi]|uniref:IS110 family transposase n=1 Tax=Curtanaerobium respiraculi TaxID=2949669 RepID=UPI0024B375E2|nr:IS110 family transposase [Curtanaerobium respiraculi]